jgi:hypothetical protein
MTWELQEMTSRIVIAAMLLVFAGMLEKSYAGSTLIGEFVWTTAEGGNGHRYESVLFDTVVSWNEARAAAEARGGYLATLTSAIENTEVFERLASNPVLWDSSPTSMADGPYIGAFRPAGAPGGSADGWTWITGEAWGYTNWAPGEPNGVPSQAQGSAFWRPGGPADTWFDHPPTDTACRSMIVEYAAAAPVPGAGIGASALLLSGFRRRRR